MVHLSTSTALYLATATLLGAVVLPASLDFAATEFGRSEFQSLAEGGTATRPPITQALGARAKPTLLTSAWAFDSE